MNGFAIVMMVITTTISYPENGRYASRYDKIDLDGMLRNDRLLNAYTKCLLDKGGCTPDGIDLRKALPEAIRRGCSQCNDKQKNGSRRVLTYLINNKPHIYLELEKIYDPNGSYRKTYCQLSRQENLQIKACN